MLHAFRSIVVGVAACLEDVVESDEVRLDVHIRMIDAVAYSRLSREVHDYVRLVFGYSGAVKPPVRQFGNR